ncbi:MAG: polyketide cyclase [Ilumatobacteraceae bacterium]
MREPGPAAPVSVSRRIEAPAGDIFRILVQPASHVELDGSGMLRAAGTAQVIGAVGDVFVMAMHDSALGDYEMENHVVEYEVDRRIGWEPAPGRGHPDAPRPGTTGAPWGHRWSFDLAPDGPAATVVTEIFDCSRAPQHAQVATDGGRAWLEAMAATLDRLAARCARAG